MQLLHGCLRPLAPAKGAAVSLMNAFQRPGLVGAVFVADGMCTEDHLQFVLQ